MKWVVRVLAVVGILVIVGIALLSNYLHVPQPEREGVLKVQGLQNEVDVYFDEFGVPHIYAANDHDLFFAAGYIAASDRLFQMDKAVRAGAGKLSEVFGDNLADVDVFLKTFGFYQTAQRIVEAMDQESRSIVQAYVDGVNLYIDTHQKNLPIEFRILRYKPMHWDLANAMSLARLMAWQLQQSWWAEILFWRLGEFYGSEKVREIFPEYPPDFPTIVQAPRETDFLFSELVKLDEQIRTLLHSEGHHQGSNNWAISGDKSITGKPILCSDPHLGYEQPAKWYEMHLVSDNLNVAGVTLAGVPGVIIGRNENIAWGLTNVMLDDIDFYVETINPDNPDQYLYDGEWKEMEVREEEIHLKSGETRKIKVRSTIHGPIISDIHPLLKGKNVAVSIRWTGHNISNEAKAIYLVDKASDWKEFLEGLKYFHVPAQNFAYADMEGNIGIHPAGKIPIRKDADKLMPFPGETSEFDWEGYVPFDEIPFLYNPEKGFVASANNKTVGESYPYYISAYWEDPSRYMRIEEVLSQDKKFSIDDMKQLQLDHFNYLAREVLPEMMQSLRGETFEDPVEKEAFQILGKWDFRSETSSIGASVFNAFFIKLAEAVYKDEMDLAGEGFYKSYVTLANIPTKNLRKILKTGESSWFDDVRTPDKTEKKDEIVLRAFHNAINWLKETYGNSVIEWRWGLIHTLTHKHDFGNIGILNSLFGFNVGPYERAGDSYAPDNGEYRWMEPFENILGPSTRRVNSMNDVDLTYSILPTGESGRPNSSHYADQAPLYNKGEYKLLPLSEEKVKSKAESHLRLTP